MSLMNGALLRRKISDNNFQDHAVDKLVTTVGRSKSCDVTINDSSLSRLHMRIEQRDGQYFVVDNNSSNGTFVNRRKVVEAPIRHGDAVIAGRLHFVFECSRDDGGDPTRPMTTIDGIPIADETISATIDDYASEDSLSPPPLGQLPDDHSLSSTLNEAETYSEAMTHPPSAVMVHERAKPITRLIALFIDFGVGLALMLPGMVASVLFGNMIGSLLSFCGSLASAAHFIVGWLKYGRTVGKHVMGIQIVKTPEGDGEGLDPKTVVLRFVIMMACCIPLFLPFLLILRDPKGRGLHDKVAGTSVVRRYP